jgi:hypothetical protein
MQRWCSEVYCRRRILKVERQMIKISRRIGRILLLFIALAILGSATVGCEYFPEATFELANESRLPKWFNLPHGLARPDVSVTMNYYTAPWGRSATFVLHDMKKHVLAKIDGKMKGTEPLQLKMWTQGDTNGYPSFEVITANGMTEIIEHKKMEPIFYITDNPAVWTELMGVQPFAVGPAISPK